MTALYRTYRPQRFEDVIGQEAAVRTLRNAISTDRVAHAYLFTGTKGTGKTTLAKLLAKAMNCVNGPTPDPCGVCESCTSIADGRSMDVSEIDAASSRKIDDVRSKIIDTVAFRPSFGTRRVYILDEAHQLTKEAFNALLKTIEEPPPHVLFIFCTTEGHEMMATVRDRCQRLALQPPASDQLVQVLRRVCDTEKIECDEPALRAIARVAQGSFRNALGTLEMLSTSFGSSFTLQDVLAHLGAVSEDVLFGVADDVLAGRAGAALVAIDAFVAAGGDVDQFARELVEHMRTLVLLKNGVESAAVGVGDAARLAAQAAAVDETRALATIDCIADASTRIRVGSDPRIAIETALVRATQSLGMPSLALRLAALEQRVTGSYGQPQQPAAAPQSAPAATPVPIPAPAAAPAASAPPAPATAPPVAAPAAPNLDVTVPAEWWDSLLASAASEAPLRPVLAGLRLESCASDRVVMVTDSRLVTDRMVAALGRHLHQVTGTRVSLEVRSAEAPADAPAPVAVAAPAPAAAPAPVAAHRSPVEPPAPATPAAGSLDAFQQAFGATELDSQ